jgi:hypothetical protein
MKVFWFFFSKKNSLFWRAAAPPAPRATDFARGRPARKRSKNFRNLRSETDG